MDGYDWQSRGQGFDSPMLHIKAAKIFAAFIVTISWFSVIVGAESMKSNIKVVKNQ